MTKTDRIRALLADGKTATEIAETVGCKIDYVRVVRYRLKAGREAYTRWIVQSLIRSKAVGRLTWRPDFHRLSDSRWIWLQ